MRCNDCNKFVSFDSETEPEIEINVDNKGLVSGNVRIVNTCQECGSELKEATLDIDVDLSERIAAHRADQTKGKHADLSVSDDGGSRTERTQNTDRHGKPIKSSRYMKRFYGAEMTITVECECGDTFEVPWAAEIQASGMDEI